MDDTGNNNGLMAATDVLAPTRVIAGKYHLGRVLGEGGMGAVYEAQHRELGAKVAVKLLSEASINNPNSIARFRREAMAMGQIHHENVISVMDAGTDDSGMPFLVMELLEGESLASTLKRERVLSQGLSAWITSEVLAGLGAAHAKNIVHRDLKPGNVFIATQSDGSRRIKLLDFGISKLGDASATLNVTAQGALVGTPNFMAPEQIRADVDLDGRVDIYAAGIMLYRMVTGRLPYTGSSAEELYRNILVAQPKPPSQHRSDIGPALEAVIFRAMHPEKQQRYQTPYQFRDDLQAAVPTESYAQIRQASRPYSIQADMGLHALGKPTGTVDLPPRPVTPGGFSSQHSHPSHHHAAPMQPSVLSHPTSAGNNKSWHWIAAIVILLGAIVGGVVTYTIARENKRSKQATNASANNSEGQGAQVAAVHHPDGEPLVFAMARHKNPKEIKAELRPLLDYLETKLDRPVEFLVVENYDDLSARLKSGDVHLAALSAAKYVKTKRQMSGLRLLATPTTKNGPTYGAYILARAGSGIKSILDLKSHTFCYTSETSSSGYLFPRAEMRQAGLDPDQELRARFTADHMESLRALQKGGCDGAAVYDQAWLAAREAGLAPTAFHVVATTGRVPWDAYCVSETLDKETTKTLADALAELKLDSPLANEVLVEKGVPFGGFIPADDSLYDPVRKLERFLEQEEQKDN